MQTVSPYTRERVSDMYRRIASVPLALALLFSLSSVAVAAAPPNDNFAGAINVSPLPFTDSRNNQEATRELGEPWWCSSYRTVWYKLQPVSDETVRFSATGNFNLDLVLWEGNTIASLVAVDDSCGDGSGVEQWVAAPLLSGHTYWVQIGSDGSSGYGDFTFAAQLQTPVNDFSVNTINVSPLPFTDSRNNRYATRELGEPWWCLSYRTVWYKLQPVSDETVVFSATGNFDLDIVLWEGNSFDSLSELNDACGDGPGVEEWFAQPLLSGHTYWVQIGSEGSSGYGDFTVCLRLTTQTCPAASPTITSVSPVAGPPGGGQSVVINGFNFSGVNWVSFGGVAAPSFTVNSPTKITAVSPAHAAGTVHVRVNTGAGTSAATSTDRYTFESAPTITSISPGAGPPGGGQSVVIYGTNFMGASWVSFGGTMATFTVVSATKITAISPAHAGGVVHVRVNTPLGTSAATNADRYAYESAPTITSVSPRAGPLGGGQSVIITGTNLFGANWVSFGGTAASFTVNSPTQITVVSPAHAAGVVHVRVNTPLGTSTATNADRYTFQ